MKKIILLLLAVVFLFLLIYNEANAQTGSLQGKVTDAKTKEGIPFATVELLDNNKLITGTVADVNGNYCIKPIVPWKYRLFVIALGYDTAKYAGVEVHADVLSFQDIRIGITKHNCCCPVVVCSSICIGVPNADTKPATNVITITLDPVFIYANFTPKDDLISICCCSHCYCNCFGSTLESLTDTTITSDSTKNILSDRLEESALHKQSTLQVFPNPATQFIRVKSDSVIFPLLYRVVSIDGKIISNGDLNSSSDAINLGSLSAGTYFIQMNTGQSWNTQKVIKL